MADKIRFEYQDLQTEAEGDLDTRGRKGLADVPVHYSAVRLRIRLVTAESENKQQRLIDLVSRYCPVDSLIKAAIPDYKVIWDFVPPEPG
jgi:uncharacterized OsmC-like protein